MYARARVTTPGGPVRVYAIHPTSPHSTFDEIRGEGLKSELLSGRALRSENRHEVASNTAERLAQLSAVAEDARTSPDPVIIGGDTNMPTLSRAFAHLFGDYHDAFAETGRGFGYSYPADKPSWMRIDRILLGPRFRVLSSFTSERRIYKHQAVVSDIELLPGGS
jgi:endonuclease/exonuclease/phosphatase family metal-dependent hydrolase